MPVARSRSEVLRYVTKADRALPIERQSVFLLRPLTNRQWTAIQNLVRLQADGESVQVMRGEQRLLALKLALVGWENFADADGAPAKWEVQKGPRTICGFECMDPVTDAALEQLSIADYTEIAEEILRTAVLSEDDVKN